jgi:glutamyl-tRNA synthetase
MSLLGWSPPDEQEIFTLEEAASKFQLERINKAGAKFDWDKLDWINSQYLHNMSAGELTDLLIPYWQEAGFDFHPQSDRGWLEEIAALIGPSLTRLSEAADMSRVFFTDGVDIDGDAKDMLRQEDAKTALQAVADATESNPNLTLDDAQAIVKTITKEQKVKKGLVMKSLRAALTGALQGPDLMHSWMILNRKGRDRPRLQQALEIANQ